MFLMPQLLSSRWKNHLVCLQLTAYSLLPAVLLHLCIYLLCIRSTDCFLYTDKNCLYLTVATAACCLMRQKVSYNIQLLFDKGER